MPAVLSAIFSAIYASFANKSSYRDSLYAIFPAMEQRTGNETMSMEHHEPMPFGVSWGGKGEVAFSGDLNILLSDSFLQGYGRTAEAQAGYQLLGIASTVAFAIVGGLITGLFLRSPSVRKLEQDKLHDDEDAWEVPAE